MYHNCRGQTFASSQWLLNHYRAKSSQITKYFIDLPIYKGDKVLDLGCGIGLQMDLILKMIGQDGFATGIDHDVQLINHANTILKNGVFTNWELLAESFEDVLPILKKYNVVVLFNCLSYYPKPLSIITDIFKNMAENSTLIVKDFDMSTSTYNPIDKQLHGELIEGVKTATNVNNSIKLNKFIGSSLHNFARLTNQFNYESRLWTYFFTFPFSSYIETFIRNAFENSIEIAGDYCSDRTIKYIKEQFITPNASFYRNHNAMFIENEHIIILKK